MPRVTNAEFIRRLCLLDETQDSTIPPTLGGLYCSRYTAKVRPLDGAILVYIAGEVQEGYEVGIRCGGTLFAVIGRSWCIYDEVHQHRNLSTSAQQAVMANIRRISQVNMDHGYTQLLAESME